MNHLQLITTSIDIGLLTTVSNIRYVIPTSPLQTMAATDHFMATDVEWDPTGRYVATCVSWWGHKVDNAYWLWSFQVGGK